MKITSGEFKYRNIEVPRDIRPTTEKVREAVFSMIRDWIPDAIVVDLFAGSGAMGLEALSRGASKCYFNEINRQNYRVLLSNISNCRAEDRSVTTNRDYKICISGINETADIVIVDPPYAELDYYKETFELLQEKEVLEPGSVVVAEHLFENDLDDIYGNLYKLKEKKYGSIGVDVFIMRD